MSTKEVSPAAQAILDRMLQKIGDSKTAKAIQDAHDALHDAGAVCNEEELEEGDDEEQEKMIKVVNDSVDCDTVTKAKIVAAVSHGRYSKEDATVFKAMHDTLIGAGATCDGLEKRDQSNDRVLIKSLMKIVQKQGEQIQAILSKPQEIKVITKMNGKMKDGEDDEESGEEDGEGKKPPKQKAIRVEGADDMIKSIEGVHKRGGRVIRNLSDVLN